MLPFSSYAVGMSNTGRWVFGLQQEGVQLWLIADLDELSWGMLCLFYLLFWAENPTMQRHLVMFGPLKRSLLCVCEKR